MWKKRICRAANLDVCVEGYTCALQREILYQGKMYVSDNWICFHSKVFGRDTKVRSPPQLWLCRSRVRRRDASMFPNHQISIPVPSVTFIKKTKTALLVPNALVIGMASCQVREPRRSFPTFHINKQNSTCFFCLSAHVCVLPVSKHYLQIPEVCLSSFGGIYLTERFHLNWMNGFSSGSLTWSVLQYLALQKW